MSEKTIKIKPKRPSKGQRTYVRRMKQLAHKEGILYKPVANQ